MVAVLLALGASASWGTGDFLGGLATRRGSVWGVIVLSQLAGLVFALVVAPAFDGPLPPLADLWPAAVGGVVGAGAIAALYAALAGGTMGVVAPIAATSAVVPVLAGLVTGERPSALAFAGIVVAIAGAMLAAREPSQGDAPRTPRRAIVLAVVAAVGIGFVFVTYAAVEDAPLWAVLIARTASVTALLTAVVVLRPALELRGRGGAGLAVIALVGLFDTGANALFTLANERGLLSVTGVLSSLYPVVTVLLAARFLGERLAPAQLAGVAAALGGVGLIALG